MQPAVRPRTILLPRRALLVFVAFLFAAFLTLPALAEYLGPDRTTTVFVEVRDPDHDVWTLTHVDPLDGLADVCLIIHTCDEHPSIERQQALCGWVADNSGCDKAYKTEEQTVLLPEATIGGVLQNCSLVDGWCTSSPTLHLTAAEPVAGESITLIEGTRNGESFACSGVVCDVPLLEGSNEFTFWALSTWGDSSQMGTLSALVDSFGPTLAMPDEWYIWEPLAIGVEDGQVGVDRVKLTIDGGSFGNRVYEWTLGNLPSDFIWDRHFGEIIAPIGEYPVSVKAWDLLGNSSSAAGLILIPAPEEPETDEDSFATFAEPASTEGPVPTAAPIAGGSVVEPTATHEPVAAVLVAEPATSIESAGPGTAATSTKGGTGGLLWGAAALAAAASATAYALSRRQDRLAEVAAKRKEAAKAASAEGFNARLGRLRSAALTRVAPIRAGMLAAAAAAAKATQEIQERRKVQYRLTQNMARLERLGPPTTSMEQMVAWQSPDPELNESYQLGRLYSTSAGIGEVGIAPGTETPTPPGYQPVQIGTPSPVGTSDRPTAAPIPIAPYPPGYIPYDPESVEGKWLGRGASLIYSGSRAYTASAIQYAALDGGRIVVVSAPSLARGTRASLLSRHFLRGGPYTRTTLSQVGLRQFTLGNLVRGAKGSVGVGLLTSLATNLWDFTVGTQRETGILSKEFAVSTGVDLIMSVGTGLVAAGLVAGGAAAAAAVAGFTAPIWGTIAAVAVVGLVIGLVLDSTGVGTTLKRNVSEGLEAWPGIIQNAGVIAQVMGGRVGDLASDAAQSVADRAVRAADAVATVGREATRAVASTLHRVSEATRSSVDRASSAIQDAAGQAVSSIANEASQAIDSAREFVGNLFGGED
ncbi:MAG TPA: hypothetical protein VI520_02875 [Anaerolineales bacterium]|nr:hypothetical protein [Anaerolineales bacterium]